MRRFKNYEVMFEEKTWSVEKVFSQGDPYFNEICQTIDAAKESIDIEIYLFASDDIGQKIAQHLIVAAERSVQVKVLVDGVGSLGWEKTYGEKFDKAGIKFKAYHQVFWNRVRNKPAVMSFFAKWLKIISQLNKRTHRKLIIIDNRIAFVGSRNFCLNHSEHYNNINVWKDISARVEGPPIEDLIYAFSRSWGQSSSRKKWRTYLQKKSTSSPYVRLNLTRKIRKQNIQELLWKLRSAKEKVWVMSGYFVPTRPILRALALAAKRGVEVHVLVPAKSDIFFLPWVTSLLYPYLLKRGVRVHEYISGVWHAKGIIIDDWTTIGSSNFNHRSLIHDLEVEVVLTSQEAQKEVHTFFLDNLSKAREVTAENPYTFGFMERCVGSLALGFRYWL